MIVQRLWKVTRVTKYFTKCSNQNWCKTLSVVLNKDEPKKANICKAENGSFLQEASVRLEEIK